MTSDGKRVRDVSMRLTSRCFAYCMVTGLLTACAGSGVVDELRSPVPRSYVQSAAVPGYGKIRFWGDSAASFTVQDLSQRRTQMLAAAKADRRFVSGPARTPTISGGGGNGALGAGLLVG